MMSLMTALVASSLAESAGTMPSPLKGLAAKTWAAASRFLNGNLRRFRLAQDLPREGGDQLAFGRGIVDAPPRAAWASL